MDALMIGWAIRVLAPLQRRGVPLPSIMAFFMTGYLVVTAVLALFYILLGMALPGAFFLVILAMVWIDFRGRLRQLADDAQAWSPKLFERYRASAGRAVVTESTFRIYVLMFWAIAVVGVHPLLYVGHPIVTFGALTITFFPLSKLMELLVRCVPPLDVERQPRLAGDVA